MKQIILPLAILSTLITANYSYARNTQNLIIGSGGNIYKVEDFLPEKNKWTFSSGLSIYENNKSSTFPQYTLNLTSIGSFFLDNSVSVVSTRTKQLNGYASFKYGVTDNLSIRGTWFSKYTRKDTTDSQLNLKSETTGNADNYNIGVSYRLDNFYPLTVLSAGTGFKAGNINSYTISSSFSWVLDPVVLTLYPSYIDGISGKKDDIKYRYFSAAGILSIALNNDVDVKFGASKDIYTTKKRNPHTPSWDTSGSLITGVTFNNWNNFVVDFTVDHELGGMDANTFSLDFSWRA
ncbi:hypothetical protein V9W07_003982 [Shigella flexneri]|nr:hypothetical protein [Escherichia coli]EIR2514456.1 hypothetical protein [Shigella flexneri]EJD0086251.1 hypothetical protein [Escherichia coli]HAI9611416.1 hypothetical protein [Escherichia coli]HBV1583225.1 hypothetical protein [Escherichia coli]